ncbi:MAG: ATP-binding cassette domain-containing protein [Bacteroidota bacterium]
MNKVIELKDVNIFQEENLILNSIDFSLNEGEFKYIIGKTGSGKSSLLKTLYADIPLKNGEGMVADYDLRKLSKKDIPFLRRKIGIVFQDFQLLNDRTVRDNLIFVMEATGWTDKAKMETNIAEVLNDVGLENKANSMPHQLSGGEQQRVVIARALLNDPILILADEPTGNLDPDTSDDIMNLLININKKTNTAILFATHDYRLIQKFPFTVVRCFEGELLEHNLMNR